MSRAAAPQTANAVPREERAVAALEQKARDASDWAVRWWWHFRFLFFVVFLLLAVVLFWLWLLSFLLGVLRFAIATLATLLSWVGGKGPHHSGPGSVAELGLGLRSLWRLRGSHYHDLARPVAAGVMSLRHMAVRWWHWSPGHKVLALLFGIVLIGVPFTYIVPRPNLVQILADDALEYHNTPKGEVRYLIHAASLTERGELREYSNQRVVWLGKIDPQRLKNELVIGRYYRLWVVGIRWKMLPTLFPIVISATEVDATGQPIENPSKLIPHVPSQPMPKP